MSNFPEQPVAKGKGRIAGPNPHPDTADTAIKFILILSPKAELEKKGYICCTCTDSVYNDK